MLAANCKILPLKYIPKGRNVLLWVICLLAISNLTAQRTKQFQLDSLTEVIKLGNDSEKVSAYFAILDPAMNPLPDREELAKTAIAFAQKVNHEELAAFACLHSSLKLINKGFYPTASSRLETAHKYYSNQPTSKLLVTTLILQGYNQHRQLFLTEALKYYVKALPLAKEIKDIKRINNLYNRIANIYIVRKDYDKAIEYAQLVLKNCEGKAGNCPFYHTILESLSKIYLTVGEIDKARAYTLLYFKEVNQKKVTANREASYKRMADLKLAEGNIAAAISYADTGLVFAKQLGRRRGVVASHEQLAKIFEQKKNEEKQLYHLQQQASLSNKYGFYFNEKEALDKLWAFYERKDDFNNANRIAKKWRAVSDTLTEVERINLLKRQDELLAQHQAQEKIQLLENQNIKKGTNNNLLLTLAVFLCAILGLTIYFLRNRRQLNTRLKHKNKLLNIAVEERNTLLKEIHHRVKNNLQIISSLLNLQMRLLKNEEAKNALAEGRNRVRSIALIHQNLYQEMNFKEIQAEKYIDSLLTNIQSTFRNSLINVEVKVAAIRLDEEVMTQIGLVINEAVTNAYKHAFAEGEKGKINLTFSQSTDHLLLVISDDGKGLPADFKLGAKPTLGLQLIQDFATRLKAAFVLKSIHPGTLLELKIPKGLVEID